MTIRPTAFEKIIKEKPIASKPNENEISAADIKAGKANTSDYLPDGLKSYLPPDRNGVSEKVILGAHQQAAARLVAKEKRVYLNFEAGTGKSLAYISAIAEVRSKTGKMPKAIISMPKKLMPNFSDEVKKFSDFNVVIVDSDNRKAREKLYNGDPNTIVLVNKEKYLFDKDMIANAGFDMMIVDEAHRSGQREGRSESGMSKGLADLATNMPYFVAGSVSPETKLFLKNVNNSKYEIITIGEFADRFGLKRGNILFGKFNYEIQAFDINNRKIEWMPITGIHRYDASMKKSYLIKGSYGHNIKITEDHSVYVIRNNSLKLLKGNEVKNTDLLIINNEQKINDGKDIIDLFKYCNMCNYNCYGEFKTEINKYEKGYQRFNYLNQSIDGSYLPYEKAIEYKCLDKTEYIKDKSYGKYGAKRFLDAKEIAYLIGLVIGDGWVEGSKNGWRIGLAIADKDVDDVKEYLDNIKGVYLNYTISKYRGCVNIRISCPPLFELFNSWFKGQRALIKRIPSDVWNWSKDAQKLILKGIIDSDGHIEHIVKRNRNFKRVSITSISKDLIFDIYCLLKQFNIIGSVYKRKFIKDERVIFKNSKQAYILRYQLNKIRKRRSEILLEKSHFNAQNVELIEIDSITEIKENDVYDISVKGHENFFANGILVHNSGTPTPNDLSELFFYLKTIAPEKFSNEKAFMEKYRNLHRGAGLKDMLTEILHKEKDDRVFTMKKDLQHTFKQHIHNTPLTELQKKQYRKVMTDYQTKKVDVLERDQRLNRILNSTKFEENRKFDQMGDIINNHFKTKGENEKVIIYAQQYKTIAEIRRYLAAKYPGAGIVAFDGRTGLNEIDANKKAFKTDKNVKFAIHTDAGTEGLNLQYTGKPGEMGATTAIAMASGANSYSTIDQFFSRANRTGVPRSMTVDGHLVLTDTPHDIRTEMRLEDKKAVMNLVDNAKRFGEVGLSKSKIVFVLR
jgi:intein/homing endonuclease